MVTCQSLYLYESLSCLNFVLVTAISVLLQIGMFARNAQTYLLILLTLSQLLVSK